MATYPKKDDAREDLFSRAFCLADEDTPQEEPAIPKPRRKPKVEKSPREKAIRSAANMLDYAPCSSARLRQKLARKGYTGEDIDAALEYVVAEGLLREARDAAHAVEYLANARLYGKRKIIESLYAKGYRREHLATADWDEIDFVEICTRYLSRYATDDREKTVAAARRRGFAMSEILEAMRRLEGKEI